MTLEYFLSRSFRHGDPEFSAEDMEDSLPDLTIHCPTATALHQSRTQLYKTPSDHINKRLLQNMISGIPV